MEVALIEPYIEHSGIGAFASGFYSVASEQEGFEVVELGLEDRLPLLNTTFDTNFRIPSRLKKIGSRYDVLFAPSHLLLAGTDPGEISADVVVFVHDLERYPLKKGNMISRLNRNRSVKRLEKCDYVFCPSEATRLSILHFTNVDPDSTHVIGEGVETIEERQPMDLEDYFLYVGAMQEGKNIDTLVKAFDRYDGAEDLVLAGRVYNQEDKMRIKRLVEDLGLKESVRFVGEVTEAELAWLYENTAGYVHPAYFEGFGRPPVEASAYGAPVAVVKGTAPAEFLEDAYKTPPTTDGIRTAMEELSDNARSYVGDEPPLWKKVVEDFLSSLDI